MLPVILVAVGAYLIGDSVLEDKKSFADGGMTDADKAMKEGYVQQVVEIATKANENGIKASDLTYEEFSDKVFEATNKSYGKEYLRGAYEIMTKKGYAEGGMMDEVNTEVIAVKGNIMGTTTLDLKIKGMRKPQDFIVYPISADQAGKPITIQSDTRFGYLDLSSGRGLMSQSHANGAYSYHFAADKKVPFKISETDVQRIKEHLASKASSKAGNSVIFSDNSGADKMAKGGMTFAVGQSVIYPTTNNSKLDKSVREQHNKYANKELVIEKIEVDNPYNTAKVFVRSTGEKVPFDLILNPNYVEQYAKGGKLVGKQKNLDVNKNGKLDAEDFKILRGEKMDKGGVANKGLTRSQYNKIFDKFTSKDTYIGTLTKNNMGENVFLVDAADIETADTIKKYLDDNKIEYANSSIGKKRFLVY